MKVRFLGTGTSQGIPVIACECRVCRSLDFRDKRLRTAVQIEVDGLSIVIDTGPDFRQQMLAAHITQLDAILLTHEHKDHTAGLDDIRAYNFKDDRDMPVYAMERVANKIRQVFDYIFAEHKYPGIPRVMLHSIDNAPFYINQTQIIPIEVMHHKLPIFGFRVKDFTYITDAKTVAEKEIQKIKGSKILVVNALRKEEHLSHFNLEQALDFIRQIKPQKAFLTHLSHNMGLHKEVSTELPDNVFIAYDGLEINC